MSRVIDITGKNTLIEQTENPSGDISKAAYAFQVFLTDYYRRVKTDYQIDFDTFMIIVVVMQHGIYEAQKVKAANSLGLDNLKKEILYKSKVDGIVLGKNFLKFHSPFADKTIKSFKVLIRQLNNSGMIDDFIKEKI